MLECYFFFFSWAKYFREVFLTWANYKWHMPELQAPLKLPPNFEFSVRVLLHEPHNIIHKPLARLLLCLTIIIFDVNCKVKSLEKCRLRHVGLPFLDMPEFFDQQGFIKMALYIVAKIFIYLTSFVQSCNLSTFKNLFGA